MSALDFGRDGAERFPALARDLTEELTSAFEGVAPAAGRRIAVLGPLAKVIGRGSAACKLAASHIGKAARPVRVIAFDKQDGANWALGWHQDRVIAVRERREVSGFGSWTVKDGQHHVQPPTALLERMVTLRLHLDPVDDQNAPLRIAPGSHHFGRIAKKDIPVMVNRCGEQICLADAGDGWLYATLILHASDRAAPGKQRRVVQIDYAADDLPDGLDWALG